MPKVPALLALALVGLAGCDRHEPPAPVASPPSSATVPGPTASAALSVEAAASAAPSAAVAPATTPKAPPPVACGTKPLPDCPLQGWMKANTSAAMTHKDFAALEVALRKTAGFAPPGYANWVSISNDGAEAAKAKKVDAVKASCRGCHEQYKTKYKNEVRARPVP